MEHQDYMSSMTAVHEIQRHDRALEAAYLDRETVPAIDSTMGGLDGLVLRSHEPASST